jgi:hypothetical protein
VVSTRAHYKVKKRFSSLCFFKRNLRRYTAGGAGGRGGDPVRAGLHRARAHDEAPRVCRVLARVPLSIYFSNFIAPNFIELLNLSPERDNVKEMDTKNAHVSFTPRASRWFSVDRREVITPKEMDTKNAHVSFTPRASRWFSVDRREVITPAVGSRRLRLRTQNV